MKTKRIHRLLKQFLGIFLAMVIVLLQIPISVHATSKSADEAIQWIESLLGQYIDHDGEWGAQCVDLIMKYYIFLGETPRYENGEGYSWNTLPNGWSRIQGATPQPGDILVYTGNSYGHVGIMGKNGAHYHQNISYSSYPDGGSPVVKITSWAYNAFTSPSYWGVVRPNFSENEFSFVPVPKNDFSYRIKNKSTGTYLVADEGKKTSMTNVSVWPHVDGSDEDEWYILEDSLGYKIHQRNGDCVLNPYSDSPTAGTNINIFTFLTGDSTQRWKVSRAGDGYIIHLVYNPNLTLGVENGHNVILKNYNSSDSTQIWYFECLDHVWNSGAVTKAATCTASGVKTYTCTVCGATKTETVPALEHSWGAWTELNDTQHQRVCSRDSSHKETANHTWNAGTVTTPATCTASGVKTYACTVCSATKSEDIPMISHIDADSNSYCDLCGLPLDARITMAQTGKSDSQLEISFYFDHSVGLKNWDMNVEYDPDVLKFLRFDDGKDVNELNNYARSNFCITEYYIDHFGLVKCAGYFKTSLYDSETAAADAKPGETVNIDSEHFEFARFIFEVLDPSVDNTQISLIITNNGGINLNGSELSINITHDHIAGSSHRENDVPATCVSAGGYDLVTVCRICGKEIARTHYDVPALGHDWSAWTITKPATATEEGVETRTCSRCTAAETRAIPKPDDPTPVETDLDIEITSVRTQAGKTVTLDVYVTKAAPISYLRVTPQYDASVLTLTGVTNGGLFDTFSQGVNLVFDADEVDATGLLATFTFMIQEDAPAGEYPVTLLVREAYAPDEGLVSVGVTPGAISVLAFVYGDVNGDGVIDGRDVIRLRKYLSDLDEDTGVSDVEIFPGADANGDGTVDGRDLIRLRKYLSNLDEDTGLSPITLGP